MSQPPRFIHIQFLFGRLDHRIQYLGPNLWVTGKIPPPYAANTTNNTVLKNWKSLHIYPWGHVFELYSRSVHYIFGR